MFIALTLKLNCVIYHRTFHRWKEEQWERNSTLIIFLKNFFIEQHLQRDLQTIKQH